MDALMQLNLMIWLAWGELPPDDPIKPVFRNSGFDLFAIGPEIPIPLPKQKAMKEHLGIHKAAVVPDLLLRHRADRKLLVLECKESSFGISSSSSKQAVGYLIVSGTEMAHILGLIPVTSSKQYEATICYVVNAEQEDLMLTTLETIQTELQEKSLHTNRANALGIYEEDDSVFLGEAADGCFESDKRVIVLEGNTSVYPLIPWDPSLGEDKRAWKDLEERLRSVFVSYLGSNLEYALESRLKITIEELLISAIPAWDVWQDQSIKKSVRRSAKRFLTDILKELQKNSGLSFQSTHIGWQISISNYNEIEKIRGILASSTVRQLPIPFEEYRKPELWDTIVDENNVV